MKTLRWRTEISDFDESGARLRGYSLYDLATTDAIPFSDLFYLTATGALPTPEQSAVLSIMLKVTVAQGISVAGAVTNTIANSGNPVQVAISAGLMTIADRVGGAGEELARDLQELIPLDMDPATIDDALILRVTNEIYDRYMASHGRVPGFGHVLHKSGDPRALAVLDGARRHGFGDGPYIRVLQGLQDRLRDEAGISIQPNIDGADAVVLSELKMPWCYARPIIMLGRMIGLSGISAENLLHKRSDIPGAIMDFDYDGVPPRPLPERYRVNTASGEGD